jgi:Tfp pilus assembly protein PilF
MRQRLAREPYRLALEGWRAFERGDRPHATRALTQALAADPANAVTRYRFAQLLLDEHDDIRARRELERVIDPSVKAPPVTHAAALVDLAQMMERRGDRTRAKALYLDAARVFGADRALSMRAAERARELDRVAPR